MPYFPIIFFRIPYFKRKFSFLEVTAESNEHTHGCIEISPKFLTFPVNELRKRNCYLAAKSSKKALRQNTFNFDLIHAHFLHNGFIGAELKSLHNKPLIVTAHGSDVYDMPFRDDWHRNIARYVLTAADKVITVSKFNAERLLSLGLSSKKLHVIPNGYDSQLFRPFSTLYMRKKMGLPLNRKILLSVGNLFAVKGHTYLIDAMKIVLKKRSDITLIIVGSGPLEEKLKKRVLELGLLGNVLLVGRKMHDEIPMWLNASDILVLPSISEGFPTVIPEAMACGKPVIGTKVGGIPEAITNDDLGILVNPRDPAAIAAAIIDALERDWQHEYIIEHANFYSWSNLAKQLLTVYENALLS